MYRYFNSNPLQNRTEDCAIRTDYKELLNIMDELMDKIEESTPKLYYSTLEKLK